MRRQSIASTDSLKDLNKRLYEKYKIFIQNTNSFRNLLNTSKGRDKCLQLFQYHANLYCTCMEWSPVYRHHPKRVDSYKKAKKFENSISTGRKIFRLFLWINEMHEIVDIAQSATLTPFLKFMKTTSCICSFIYYFSDNAIWLAKIGYTGKEVPFSEKLTASGNSVPWSRIKDNFSLSKTCLELFIFTCTYYLKSRDENDVLNKLLTCGKVNEVISRKKIAFVYLRKLIIIRREKKFI
jgi:hypothetical protein